MRRSRPEKRVIPGDIRYNNPRVTGLINSLMKKGKKSIARRVVYEAFDLMAERANKDPVEMFEQAIKNISPRLEVKPRRVGGATYQVPIEVLPARRGSLAMRWLLEATRNRPGKTMAEKLANELMDAAGGTGAAIKRKEDTHRMAEANRAFAHYRW